MRWGPIAVHLWWNSSKPSSNLLSLHLLTEKSHKKNNFIQMFTLCSVGQSFLELSLGGLPSLRASSEEDPAWLQHNVCCSVLHLFEISFIGTNLGLATDTDYHVNYICIISINELLFKGKLSSQLVRDNIQHGFVPFNRMINYLQQNHSRLILHTVSTHGVLLILV